MKKFCLFFLILFFYSCVCVDSSYSVKACKDCDCDEKESPICEAEHARYIWQQKNTNNEKLKNISGIRILKSKRKYF